MKVSNDEIRKRSRSENVTEYEPRDRINMSFRNDQERREEGTIVKERAQLGFSTWDKAETAAKDKATWKKMIGDPILH